jgi:creatinine amidohydrolase/Fe(II)-dependent formamide hydrolase-like protein
MRDTRYLPNLTWTEIRDLEKLEGVVVLPIGAIEQHGPHLPVATDALLAEAITRLALERLGDDVRVWRLPVQSYGKSNEHLGFAGTVSLRAETLMAVVMDIASSVKASGFRRLCFVNAHGGNSALLAMMAREIRVATGLMVFNTFTNASAPDPVEIPPLEARFGIHANDWETSLVLHLEPELVHMERAVREYPQLEGEVGLTGGAAVAAWLTRDWSASGVFGDPTVATPERGAQRLETCVTALAQTLTAISRFEIPGQP